jgi:putative ABC transport system ATP-binding protein
VAVDGETLVGRSEDELAIMRRRHIGIVFQFFNLLEGMTVLENLIVPAVIAGAPRKRAETRARDLLDLLGLADKAKDQVDKRGGSDAGCAESCLVGLDAHLL